MLARILRNMVVFFGFDLLRTLVHTSGLDLAWVLTIITISIEGLLRPVEILLLALLSTQFSNKGRGGTGFKLQLAAILVIAVGYLFQLNLLLDRVLWTAIITWLIYDWSKIPVAQAPITSENKLSE